jgi:hypothetical protein
MATYDCVLDQVVHRCAEIGTLMTPDNTFPRITLQRTTDLHQFPEGLCLEIIFTSGGNPSNFACPGMKSPKNIDCIISTPTPPLQDTYELDDFQLRVLVLGNELFNNRDFSLVIVNKRDVSTGQTGDFFLYADKTETAVSKASKEIPAGGSGLKIPPNLGIVAKR